MIKNVSHLGILGGFFGALVVISIYVFCLKI